MAATVCGALDPVLVACERFADVFAAAAGAAGVRSGVDCCRSLVLMLVTALARNGTPCSWLSSLAMAAGPLSGYWVKALRISADLLRAGFFFVAIAFTSSLENSTGW